MSYPFDLNRFFKAPIIKIDNRVRPPNLIQREFDECQKEINLIIDGLGNASAKAQHLHAAVTSSSKLASSDHFMYLIKDPEGNGGYGLAIGFLKIGFKKLYVYDLKGEMHEREPLCVLDFYIRESYQRQGYGKRLYDYMLMHEKMEPPQLAIDRPSLKFSSFLKKHYGLSHSIPQTNNFVIFEGFFSNQSEGNCLF
ncbi:ATAT1 [Acanthosepion pharaonis]|uniref:Alpha-tubulin N-acetyltransferase n=1 Tax=Acanthosepion pharaonis TaxID=158019 RepID=A0A812BX51_ACAPH|nr:ATAT1 [Sepia pharaonis]